MSGQPVLEKKNYWSLDVAKFFCALTIISAHFAAEWGHFPRIIDYAFSIYVLAVPFFFCCSGFLFFQKMSSLNSKEERKEYFLKYQKRLWIMYGLWTIVYLPFQMYDWMVNRDFLEEVVRFIHRALVIQTYATIWFIPALAVGIAIVYFLTSKFSKKQITAIVVLLYIFGMLGHTYNFLLEGTVLESFFETYLDIFKTSRNAVFNATPFVFMGYLVSKHENEPSKRGLFKYGFLAICSLGLLVAESFVLKLNFKISGMDIGIFIVPFTYFFIKAALNVSLKECFLWIWFRKLSLGVFLSQRIFLSALPIIFNDFFEVLYESNSYIGLILVLTFTITFSIAMVKCSEKVKFFKYFM